MSTLAYRREIDGLRAIAVVAVVLYHLDAGILPGGFAGVDVFFVLSGYLITLLLAKEWQATGRIDAMDFYARRARRLLPALLLVVGSVLVLSTVLIGPMGSPFKDLTESALASVLFVANIYFMASAGDYFANPSDQLPLLHLWSLAVEEQFYLVFPLLLWLMFLRGIRFSRVTLVGLSVGSILLAEHWLQVSPERAFFLMPSRFWELAAGSLVALSAAPSLADAPGVQRRAVAMAVVGMAIMVGSLWVGAWQGHFPGLGALPSVLGTVLLLRAVHMAPDLSWLGRGLSARPLVRLGRWSYPLYLWHWPLLALDRAVSLSPSPLHWRAALCLLAIGLAGLTYRFVEQPIRRGWPAPSRRVLLVGGFASVLVLASAHGLGQVDWVPAGRRELAMATQLDRPPGMVACHYSSSSLPSSATPPGCGNSPGPAPRVVIWGDSHALAMWPFADVLARSRGTTTQPMTMDSCPPLVGPVQPDARFPLRAPRCQARNELAIDAIRTPGSYDLVVLGGLWQAYIQAPGDRGHLSARLEATLALLADVPEVVLVASVPSLPHPAPACIAAGLTEACATPRREFERRAEPLRQQLRVLAERFPNLTVVDPTAFFCDDQDCPVIKDGYSLFWDDDHVSATAARAFGEDYLAHPSRYTLATGPRPGPPPPE